MRKFLVVVDMQNDFVTGVLGSSEAVQIVPNVVDKVKNFDGTVIFTKDTHYKNYLETQEGSMLPVPHCIAYTEGWELIEELEELQMKGHWSSYQKNTFGCVNLAIDLLAEHVKQKIDSIELVGVCTDICVISNALLLKAYLPEVPIIVDSSCCAGVTPESHETALNSMKSCQIIVK